MNAAQFDYLIVGAGIYGATAARVLTEAGKSVAVIDRRDVVAGNCYDEDIEWIRFNLYGGHIFHTNSERVWNFVNRFAQWQSYTHRVSACVDGKLYSFPPNLLTLNQIWGIKTPQDAAVAYNDMAKMETIREMFFRGYSEKQWASHIARFRPASRRAFHYAPPMMTAISQTSTRRFR
jgi:UDP-galactopyranose mutase